MSWKNQFLLWSRTQQVHPNCWYASTKTHSTISQMINLKNRMYRGKGSLRPLWPVLSFQFIHLKNINTTQANTAGLYAKTFDWNVPHTLFTTTQYNTACKTTSPSQSWIYWKIPTQNLCTFMDDYTITIQFSETEFRKYSHLNSDECSLHHEH
jgi:hypothetical protein